MTAEKETPICAMYGDSHRYFIFKVVEVFEPVNRNEALDSYNRQLYEKVEYAISGCNCGSAVRQKVKQ